MQAAWLAPAHLLGVAVRAALHAVRCARDRPALIDCAAAVLKELTTAEEQVSRPPHEPHLVRRRHLGERPRSLLTVYAACSVCSCLLAPLTPPTPSFGSLFGGRGIKAYALIHPGQPRTCHRLRRRLPLAAAAVSAGSLAPAVPALGNFG